MIVGTTGLWKMNEFEKYVYEVLQRKYLSPEWIILPQVSTHTGCATPVGGTRYIDFFIINTYPSKHFKCIAVEVKKTIEDYRSDYKDIRKQLLARFYSDEFYYLFPESVYIKYEAELLLNWKEHQETGYMVIHDKLIRKARHGAVTSKSPFSMSFICSLLRRALR